MESPGKFLLIDDETTKLLQVLAKIHPYGNKTVLKIILKFYLRLVKYARKKKVDPVTILIGILEREVSEEFVGLELEKVRKIDRLMEKAGAEELGVESAMIAGEIASLKAMLREMRGSGEINPEINPKEKAQLLKIDSNAKPKEKADYRQLRKKKRPRKIEL